MSERRRARVSEPSDEMLMTRYADGDPRAFEALFRRYERHVFAFFRRRTGSPERAQDLYQELFLRIHRARHRFDPARPFGPWLFQIAQRLLVDDQRRAHRSREILLGDPEAVVERPSGEERIADRELLGRAFASLSAEERHVLLASKLDGTSHEELAAELGKSAGAVRKLASRALQRLRALPFLVAARPPGARVIGEGA